VNTGGPLEVRRRPRSALAVWTVAVAVVLGLVFWFVTSPPVLATSTEPVLASTPVDQDVYVAVVTGDPDRSLTVSGVAVHVAAEMPVEVEPLLCVDGSPRVTSDPTTFCSELVAPDGRTLDGGDTLVLRVRSEYAGVADIDTVRVGYRDGVRWATQPAGAPVRVTVLGR
jgi:hypothetical protein